MLYDEEFMIKDAANLFIAKLNDEIDIINAEKADTLAIDNIPSDKYIFEALDTRTNNFKGYFIIYGILDAPLREPNENNMIEDTTLYFHVCTFDNGEKQRNDTLYKLLRYRRALKQVVFKNPDIFRGYAKASVASLKPDAIPLDNRFVLLNIGINIKASVTAN